MYKSGWQGVQPWSWDQFGEEVTYMKEALLCHRDWDKCSGSSSSFSGFAKQISDTAMSLIEKGK